MIDVYNVITNGIITKDNTVRIIDPLGYFVVLIEEEIVEVLVDDFGGSVPSGLRKSKTKKVKKLIKRVKITVCGLENEDKCYEETITLNDVNLNVSQINFVNNEIHLTISGENVVDEITTLTINEPKIL